MAKLNTIRMPSELAINLEWRITQFDGEYLSESVLSYIRWDAAFIVGLHSISVIPDSRVLATYWILSYLKDSIGQGFLFKR